MKNKIIAMLKKKREGIDTFVYTIGTTVFVIILILYIITSSIINSVHNQIDDAIISAELASALMDVEEYSKNKSVLIDKTKSLKIFSDYLKANLGITEITTEDITMDDGETLLSDIEFNGHMIGNKIKLNEFTIYNIDLGHPKKTIIPAHDGLSEVFIPEKGGRIIKSTYRNGIWLPDVVIEQKEHYEEDWNPSYDTGHGIIYETSIYAEIEVPMHTFFNISGVAAKSKLVSIKNII